MQEPGAAMAAADFIVRDTLGKLHAHGHGLSGWCRAPRRRSGRATLCGKGNALGANSFLLLRDLLQGRPKVLF